MATSYDEMNWELCTPGTYRIITVNGSIYDVEVPEDSSKLSTVQRLVDAFPRDPQLGRATMELHRDGEKIPLTRWIAAVGNAGATFFYYDPDARISVSEQVYMGTRRWTSAVVSIEKLDSDD